MPKKLSKYWSQYVVLGLVLIFSIQAFFLANKLEFGMAPDEVFHYNQIINFSHTISPFLENNDVIEHRNPEIAPEPMGKAYYLTISKSSFLYHWLMSFLLKLNFFHISNLLFLRLINILLIIAYFYYFYKLSKHFLDSEILVVLIFLLHVFLPMFIFISSSVSYDNLVNLISVAALYYLFKFIQVNEVGNFLAVVSLLLVGSLVKFSFIPLAFTVFIILFFVIIKKETKFASNVCNFFKIKKIRAFLIIPGIIFLIMFNSYIIVRNVIVYKSIQPNCSDIFTYATCWQEDYIFKRDQIFINTLPKQKVGLASLGLYFTNWSDLMVNNTVNFVGHTSHISFVVLLLLGKMMIIFLFFSFLFNINKKNILLIIISLAYGLVIFFYNYFGFIQIGHSSRSVQGRYIFPILSLFLIIFAQNFLFFISNKKIRLVITFTLVMVLVFLMILTSLVNFI